MADDRFGVRDACHDYSGVVVLQGVSLELVAGRVKALIGENGSGKSTLIKILTGALKPRRGHLEAGGRAVVFNSPQEAKRHGIGVVHQDYNLFPHLTVAENVFGVAKSPPRTPFGTVDHGAIARRVSETLVELGVDISPSARVRTLGPAERKFVEVARAMLSHPRFLILDEPTASLEPNASHSVLALLDRLRAQGVGILFVSHRLDEITRIADDIAVLRDGRLVRKIDRAEASEELLVDVMMGEPGKRIAGAPSARRVAREPGQQPVLRVRDMEVRPGRPAVSFTLEKGEILGFTGLLGSGPARAVRMVGGAEPLIGSLHVHGKSVRIRSPRDASRAGIGFIPEDRKASGLVGPSSVAINISLADLGAVSRGGVVRRARVRGQAEHFRERMDIRCRDVDAPVMTLSGGNQQKVMIARWLASGVQILVIEEPTHGVDVRGKAQIHDLLRAFAAGGGSVLIASTDVHEIVEVCDRIALFRHGALTEILATEQLSSNDVAVRGQRDSEQLLEHLVEGNVAEVK